MERKGVPLPIKTRSRFEGHNILLRFVVSTCPQICIKQNESKKLHERILMLM